MKTNSLSHLLRWAAMVVVIAGLAVWIAAGARIGWTQTDVVRIQHDEVTGIDYPVRHPAFRPGVEVPLAAIATGTLFAGIAWAARRRNPVDA